MTEVILSLGGGVQAVQTDKTVYPRSTEIYHFKNRYKASPELPYFQ